MLMIANLWMIILFFFVTKYVEIDYYFIQDMVKKKKIQIRFIFFEHQLTDIFTKPIYIAFKKNTALFLQST
jgi:hypothetical protein